MLIGRAKCTLWVGSGRYMDFLYEYNAIIHGSHNWGRTSLFIVLEGNFILNHGVGLQLIFSSRCRECTRFLFIGCQKYMTTVKRITQITIKLAIHISHLSKQISSSFSLVITRYQHNGSLQQLATLFADSSLFTSICDWLHSFPPLRPP